MDEVNEIGLYIHIPFCKSKCYYCDFVSYTNMEEYQERYTNCVIKELKRYALENDIMSKHGLEKKYVIKTIYIGGGTPSIIDEIYIVNILKMIRTHFEVEPNVEITIEVNPGTVTKSKLQTYRDIGINRLSIGLQTINDQLLKKIGRIHTYQQFKDIYINARDVGFNNINVDLMIGLPDQTLDEVKESVKTVLALKPEHISVYSLILEEITKLEKMVKNKELKMISYEKERDMYWYVKNALEKHKYNQYEISNYAKVGFESQHNLDCWKQKEYIGLGAAASSFLEDKRYSNTHDVKEYIKNIENNMQNKNLKLDEALTQESKMKEYMMLGL